jgi:hypothetical protein
MLARAGLLGLDKTLCSPSPSLTCSGIDCDLFHNLSPFCLPLDHLVIRALQVPLGRATGKVDLHRHQYALADRTLVYHRSINMRNAILLASLAASTASAETVLGVYIFSRHGDRTAKSTPPTSLTDLGFQEVCTYIQNTSGVPQN